MANQEQKSNARKDNQGGRPGSGRREARWGETSNWLDDWLAIGTDGTITAFSGKVELGTGVRTALAQIVAEELDVALERRISTAFAGTQVAVVLVSHRPETISATRITVTLENADRQPAAVA